MTDKGLNLIIVNQYDSLYFEGKTYRCAIGSKGFTALHKEGDNATPLGTFALRECWYRADRIEKPETVLLLRTIEKDDGWCDEPTDSEYNKYVKLPFAASHEKLWREDRVYDIIVPIGFNDNPPVPGAGSAIFLHLAKPDYSPTQGCVAVAYEDMIAILKQLTPQTRIAIAPES